MARNKHGYWKVWGHSATCSECGLCVENLGDNFCMRCGARMNGEPTIDIPTFKLPDLITAVCNKCGKQRIVAKVNGYYNYCPNCGAEMAKGENDEQIY